MLYWWNVINKLDFCWLHFGCFVQVYVGCKVYWKCIRLMQDCMKLFSAAAKLFVWCLRLRVQKARPSHCWHWVYKSKMCFQLQKFGDCIIYWALRWQRHSETNAISIWSSKQAATFFFPMFEHSEKCTHSFLLQVHVCIIIIGVISERHTSPDRVRPITLVAGLCTTCRGDRVLVVTKFNVTFLPLRPY